MIILSQLGVANPSSCVLDLDGQVDPDLKVLIQKRRSRELKHVLAIGLANH